LSSILANKFEEFILPLLQNILISSNKKAPRKDRRLENEKMILYVLAILLEMQKWTFNVMESLSQYDLNVTN